MNATHAAADTASGADSQGGRVVKLDQLRVGQSGIVRRVDDQVAGDPIARRLRDLGFVAGESVRLVARGPLGREPLLVQVGFTRFALRGSEAARVCLVAEAG